MFRPDGPRRRLILEAFAREHGHRMVHESTASA
jgi:hypothetical protein